MTKTTIAHLIKQENELWEEWALREGWETSQKRKHEGEDPDVNAALNARFAIVTRQGIK